MCPAPNSCMDGEEEEHRWHSLLTALKRSRNSSSLRSINYMVLDPWIIWEYELYHPSVLQSSLNRTLCCNHCKMALILHLSLYQYPLPHNFMVSFCSDSMPSHWFALVSRKSATVTKVRFERYSLSWACLLLHLCPCLRTCQGETARIQKVHGAVLAHCSHPS